MRAHVTARIPQPFCLHTSANVKLTDSNQILRNDPVENCGQSYPFVVNNFFHERTGK